MSGSAELVTYPVTVEAIAEAKAKYAGLSCDTPAGYEQVRLAIAHVRTTRVAVEDRRVALKADALAYGRLVDSRAKEITALLVEIEEPLKAKKQAVDDEKARARAEAEAAKLRALEAEIAARRAAQEEEARLVREAEEKRLAEERAALEAERAKLAEAQAALEAARAAEAAAWKRAEAERIARMEAERKAEADRIEAAARAERDRLEAERRAEAERQRAERDRIAAEKRAAEIAALRPDLEKIAAFSAQIRALVPPEMADPRLTRELIAPSAALARVADDLDDLVRLSRG